MIRTALMLALLTTPALASGIAMPPARYDHEPAKHYGVIPASQARLNSLCKPPPGMKAVGCTVAAMRMIYILDTLGPKKRALVLRHERGHINGWKH